MLEGLNLSKSYGGQAVLRDAGLTLTPGQICVLIGPSGSGKTTLLKTLALLERPDRGRVTVDDQVYDFPAPVAGKFIPPWPRVSVVFQQLFLWPHLTLLQNITLPMNLRFDEERADRVAELIDLFGMGKFIYRYPNQASLGQRQRAALARALLLDPEYLLLDEITSSLDVEQTAIILDTLKELAAGGIGILIITHLLHFAREAADHVVFMDGGEVIESGGKAVLASPAQERVKRFLSVIESAT